MIVIVIRFDYNLTNYKFKKQLDLLLFKKHISGKIRPIVVLRIFKSGVWANQLFKRRRWIFLARRLIS